MQYSESDLKAKAIDAISNQKPIGSGGEANIYDIGDMVIRIKNKASKSEIIKSLVQGDVYEFFNVPNIWGNRNVGQVLCGFTEKDFMYKKDRTPITFNKKIDGYSINLNTDFILDGPNIDFIKLAQRTEENLAFLYEISKMNHIAFCELIDDINYCFSVGLYMDSAGGNIMFDKKNKKLRIMDIIYPMYPGRNNSENNNVLGVISAFFSELERVNFVAKHEHTEFFIKDYYKNYLKMVFFIIDKLKNALMEVGIENKRMLCEVEYDFNHFSQAPDFFVLEQYKEFKDQIPVIPKYGDKFSNFNNETKRLLSYRVR